MTDEYFWCAECDGMMTLNCCSLIRDDGGLVCCYCHSPHSDTTEAARP